MWGHNAGLRQDVSRYVSTQTHGIWPVSQLSHTGRGDEAARQGQLPSLQCGWEQKSAAVIWVSGWGSFCWWGSMKRDGRSLQGKGRLKVRRNQLELLWIHLKSLKSLFAWTSSFKGGERGGPWVILFPRAFLLFLCYFYLLLLWP